MKKICLFVKSEIFVDSTLKEMLEYNKRQPRLCKYDIVVISDNLRIIKKCQLYKIECVTGKQLYSQCKEIYIMIIEHKLPDINAFIIHKCINHYADHNIYTIYISQDKEQVFNAFNINVMGYIYMKNNFYISKYERKLKEILNKIYVLNQKEKKFLLYGKISSAIVEYIKADNVYVEIHMANGDVYLERDKISELEKVLKNYNFVLIHRSYLINLEYIKEIGNKNVQLIYNNIPMSRQGKEKLIERLSCEMNR